MDTETQFPGDAEWGIAQLLEDCKIQKALITELCDALEEEFGAVTPKSALYDKRPWNLIRRAREAVK